MKNKKKIVAFVLLQIALFVSSFGAVCSKKAGKEAFLSRPFIVFYGLLLLILFVYAIVWQQVLKELPLTIAYASKGIGVFYGMMWGWLFFEEHIRWNMVLGAVIVLAGVYLNLFDELRRKK